MEQLSLLRLKRNVKKKCIYLIKQLCNIVAVQQYAQSASNQSQLHHYIEI